MLWVAAFDLMHLSGVDIDLLVALHALLETQSVKEASRRLSLSRSATSHALARLRALFGDPLLVRSGRGLVRTPRGDTLRPELARWIGDTKRLLGETSTFDPATAERDFRIGTTDYTEPVLVVGVSRRANHQAPGVDLLDRRVGIGMGSAVAELRSGAADLVLGPLVGNSVDIIVEPLYQERYVCLVRQGHPVLGAPLTPERFAGLTHVLVAPGGSASGIMDDQLAAVGLVRRVARTVATFSVAPELVTDSDHILTLASRLAKPMAARLGLVIIEAPFAVQFPVCMAWHVRSHDDPAHVWLREQFREVAAAGETEPTDVRPPTSVGSRLGSA